jgi:hypothetical protein
MNVLIDYENIFFGIFYLKFLEEGNKKTHRSAYRYNSYIA